MTSKYFNNDQISKLYAEFLKREAKQENSSLRELAVWTKENFHLETIPHTSTISRILKKNGTERNRGRQFK